MSKNKNIDDLAKVGLSRFSRKLSLRLKHLSPQSPLARVMRRWQIRITEAESISENISHFRERDHDVKLTEVNIGARIRALDPDRIRERASMRELVASSAPARKRKAR